jgi:hypothetical protein
MTPKNRSPSFVQEFGSAMVQGFLGAFRDAWTILGLPLRALRAARRALTSAA